MKAGDIVKFHTPLTEEEVTALFVIVEMRDERVLVKKVNSRLAIVPQSVFFVSDLEVVYEC